MWESDKLTALNAMKRTITSAICIALYAIVALGQTVESGKRLYQGLCVGCHGDDGAGGGHGPGFLDVRPRARHESRDAVRNLILSGNSRSRHASLPDTARAGRRRLQPT